MNSIRWPAVVLICGVLALQQAVAGPLSQDGPQITAMEIGLGGQFKVGFWTPVRLTVRSGSREFEGQVRLTSADSDDVSAVFVQGPASCIRIPAQQEWTGWRYFKLGRIDRGLRATLHDADGTLIDSRDGGRALAHPSASQWVLTAGSDVEVGQASVLLARMRNEKLVTSRLADPTLFPDRWYGYEGVNMLLAPTGKQNPLEMLSDVQFEALMRWIQMGGRFVFSAGKRAPDLFRAGNRFFDLRPGDFLELDDYWKASGLENYVRASERVANPEQTPMAVFSGTHGRVLCFEGAGGKNDRPLVIHYPYGFGEITYVALDLDLPPLSQWAARPRLLARLLQTRSEEEESAMGGEGLGQVTHLGFNDLSGQLRSALDQFSGVTLVRFSWIAALLVLYIVLLGPVDFFGLRKLKRPHWTWVTFPLILIGMSALAVGLAGRWKGNRLKLNRVDVVDIDIEKSLARGTTWANIYSPSTVRLDVELIPDPAIDIARQNTEVILSWLGLPGSGLGGMSAPATVDVLSDPVVADYTIDNPLLANNLSQGRVEDLPISTSSTKGLIGRWWTETESLAPSRLSIQDNGLLQGTVVNPLNTRLSQCAIYFENWAYRLDRRLEAGDSVDIEQLTPLDLKWLLTRRRVVDTDDVSTPWNRGDVTDPARIVEMLMFHGAAGGEAYTRLTHRYHAEVDLSRHLRAGRAMLVGQSRSPASRLAGEDPALGKQADQQFTFYRIVIPVQRSPKERTAQ